MEVYQAAVGDCIVCGKDAEGSLYWTPPPDATWQIVRAQLEPLTSVSPHSGVKLIANQFFIKPDCKPFCSPVCVGVYYARKAADHCKRGG